ncbi:hypothetical protein JHK87_015981 [Glycine soja]|nr:hypothetical protein JHK87_015981 [Glycine soja]
MNMTKGITPRDYSLLLKPSPLSSLGLLHSLQVTFYLFPSLGGKEIDGNVVCFVQYISQT